MARAKAPGPERRSGGAPCGPEACSWSDRELRTASADTPAAASTRQRGTPVHTVVLTAAGPQLNLPAKKYTYQQRYAPGEFVNAGCAGCWVLGWVVARPLSGSTMTSSFLRFPLHARVASTDTWGIRSRSAREKPASAPPGPAAAGGRVV